MKIAFYADDPKWSQLSNGGGTRTILRSVQALKQLGHDAYVVAHKDAFTWFKHDEPRHKIDPDTDAVVAVHIHDVKHVIKMTGKYPVVAYWMRPAETWSMQKGDVVRLIARFKEAGGMLFANSLWQARDGVKLQLAGMDEFWEPGARKRRFIGFRYHSRTHDNGMDLIAQVASILGPKYRWACVGYTKASFVEKVIPTADDEGMRKFYQKCRFFVGAPRFAGFFNPGAEAAMCGCQVGIIDHPCGGWQDYAPAVYAASSPRAVADWIEARWDMEYKPNSMVLSLLGTRLEQMASFAFKLKKGMK